MKPIPTLMATIMGISNASAATSPADRAFVAMVSQGGMFEVALGQLATTQASVPDIQDQGETETTDHRRVGDALHAAAADAGITFPATLGASFQKKLDDFKPLTGPAFDRAYLLAMADIHAKDGAAFAKEAAGGTNPALRAFAAATHRIVLRHIGELKAVGPGGS